MNARKIALAIEPVPDRRATFKVTGTLVGDDFPVRWAMATYEHGLPPPAILNDPKMKGPLALDRKRRRSAAVSAVVEALLENYPEDF